MQIDEPQIDVRQMNESYYAVDSLWVVPSDTSAPMLHESVYDQLSQDRDDTPAPLLVTAPGIDYHLRVHPTTAIEIGVIELPREVVESLDIDRVPSLVQFKLASGPHARNLFRINGTDLSAIEG